MFLIVFSFFFPFRERLTFLFDVSSVLLFLSALSLFCTTQSVFLKPLQMEEYVTETLLKQTSCRAPYPNLVLRCVVLSTVPLRTCEFSDEKVFTAVGSIAASSPDRGSACGDTVRVNFYGSWGTAAAFMDPGDVIVLHGFFRLEVPCTPDVDLAGTSSLSSSAVLCPLPEEEGCVLRVLQPGKSGDVMEVVVTPSNMDAICIRGLTPSDVVNHLYVQQCVQCAQAQQ